MRVKMFKIGDTVTVTEGGSGCGPDAVGRIVKITGIGEYDNGATQIGYKVSPAIGNTKSGSHGGFIGENSFKLIKHSSWKERFK